MPLRRRHRLAEEVEHRHARDLLRVLEAEEQARGRPLVGGSGGDVLAAEEDAAGGDLVRGVAEQGVGERRLARAVRPHEGVDAPGADREA